MEFGRIKKKKGSSTANPEKIIRAKQKGKQTLHKHRMAEKILQRRRPKIKSCGEKMP